MLWQASFAKWNEGQKDRPKQVTAALEAHKARVTAATAAAQQQKEALTVKPVAKGKKEQPLELHPDQFVRIKAHKAAGPTSTTEVSMNEFVEATASPAVDVEVTDTQQSSIVAYSNCSQSTGCSGRCWPQASKLA